MKYRDFEVRIQAGPTGGYTVEVLRPTYGQTVAERFKLPFPAHQMRKIPDLFERLRDGRGEATPPVPTAEEIGKALYRSLFSGEVGKRFHESLAHVEATEGNEGLRIRLSFDLNDPFLLPVVALPWELLWDARRGDFLCRIRHTPIARFLPVDRPPLAPCAGPLRVLVVQSAPADLSALNLTAEWREIWEALHPHPGIEIKAMLHPTLARLRQKLCDETWHVLHFMGHGAFHPENQEGHLCFEDPAGRVERVPGSLLGEHLKSCPRLRLVFLNACESGVMRRHDGQDPFSGVAPALLRAGVPAVIAMQSPINDRPAIALSATFYARIAAHDPVDAALVEGRLAILRSQSFDWATPILFTRVPDGDILGPVGSPVAVQPAFDEVNEAIYEAEEVRGGRTDVTAYERLGSSPEDTGTSRLNRAVTKIGTQKDGNVSVCGKRILK